MKRQIWMPHAAHFIGAASCQFHLATKVGRVIISTIGEYFPDQAVRRIHAEIHAPGWYAANKHEKGDGFDYLYMKKFGFMEIGLGRKYETMVFKSIKVPNESCCPYVIDVTQEIPDSSQSYNDPIEAYKGHIKLVNKYSK